MRFLAVGLLFLAGLKAQDSCPVDPDSTMLLKRIAELTAQVNQMNMRAVLLRMQIAQKEEQVDFYMACAYAGIVPDGACEVNAESLTVSRKGQEKAK